MRPFIILVFTCLVLVIGTVNAAQKVVAKTFPVGTYICRSVTILKSLKDGCTVDMTKNFGCTKMTKLKPSPKKSREKRYDT